MQDNGNSGARHDRISITDDVLTITYLNAKGKRRTD
jgi:hypothetical protein